VRARREPSGRGKSPILASLVDGSTGYPAIVPAYPETALPATGALIDGKYRVDRVLGEGGMGIVFQATHVRLGQRVAIKMLHPTMLAKPEIVERFEREARAAAQLRSPNAVRVVDVDVTPEHLPYMVMEFLDGHDLSVELESRGRFSVPDAVDCVLQACWAMNEAHALGIVHRDLKPSNLFLAREGANTVVKVLDFGISKMAATELDVHVTSTLATMGTPLYMSPEQIRSTKNVDARADVWSLGVILFELLAGRPPFTGSAMAVSAAIVADPPTSLRELQPGVPESLERVVLKALAKTPDARWPDVQSLAAALAPFAGGRVSILPPGARERIISSPSMASGPTLAAPTPGIRISPLARTEATAPGTTPPPVITAGSWASQPAGTTRPRRGRVAFLAALATVPLVAIAVGAVVVLRSARSTNDVSVAAAPSASQPAAAPSAMAAAAPAPVESVAASAVASVSGAPAVKAPPLPRGRPVVAAPPVAGPARTSPPPPAAPTTTANPVRL
jgi:serine/threonine-protein kinase